jgi:hypothetical protein
MIQNSKIIHNPYVVHALLFCSKRVTEHRLGISDYFHFPCNAVPLLRLLSGSCPGPTVGCIDWLLTVLPAITKTKWHYLYSGVFFSTRHGFMYMTVVCWFDFIKLWSAKMRLFKVAFSVTWRKMKYSRFFFFIYTSNKVMQVCLITVLIVKRYKRKNYSFVIILLNIRLI